MVASKNTAKKNDDLTNHNFITVEHLEAVASFFKEFQKSLKPVLEALSKTNFIYFGKQFQDLEPTIQFLAKLGWYLPYDFPLSFSDVIKSHINKNDLNSLDKEMIRNYKSQYSEIKKTILDKFPDRSHALKEAFRAHEKKWYYLSIPVFLSQVEGICKELTQHRFFSTRNGIPQTASFVESLDIGEITFILLSPLKDVSEFNRKQNNLKPSGANRHDILHGESMDYGTKINSFKSFSLLAYIGYTVSEILTEIARKNYA